MSGCRGFKQREPRTYLPRSSGTNIDLFLQSDFDAWVAANPGLIDKVGDVYTIRGTTDGTTFSDVLRGINGATILNYNTTIPTSGSDFNKSLKNLGKQVFIGNGVDSTLLIFRLVEAAGLIINGGLGQQVGFVVVENNADDLTRPRFFVQVSAGN